MPVMMRPVINWPTVENEPRSARPNSHDQTTCHEHGSSAEFSSNEVARDRAHNTSDIIQRSDVSLHRRIRVIEHLTEIAVCADDA